MAVLTDHVSTYHIGVFFFAQSPESRPDSAGTVDLANLANITKILQGILEGASLHALWSRRLSERACYQLYQASHPQYFTYRGLANHPAIKAYEKEHSLELVFQPFNCTAFRHGKQLPYRFPIRFAVFDMDSTLINQEIIDELAASIGATQAVAAITERAMAGEVDFAESLKARVALLKGIRTDVWDHLKQRITFSEGVPELCKALKKLGVKTAVLSGGFIEMATWAKEILGLDYAYANHLAVENNHLTGALQDGQPIITAAVKRIILAALAEQDSIPLSSVLCVGDGANDLDMLNLVGDHGGWGVAFKAKTIVQQQAPARLNSRSMLDLLYLMGRKEEDVADLISDSEYIGDDSDDYDDDDDDDDDDDEEDEGEDYEDYSRDSHMEKMRVARQDLNILPDTFHDHDRDGGSH